MALKRFGDLIGALGYIDGVVLTGTVCSSTLFGSAHMRNLAGVVIWHGKPKSESTTQIQLAGKCVAA